ncbi:MAG TPA: hypothetical protein VHL10_07145 [Nitrososphaera sp.]|jgi:hypothetical protein|nr:hypothetical protein [Nitrososphaera sp.]
MAMPKNMQGVRLKQQKAFGDAIKLVKRQMEILKKGQDQGEPIKGNTEAYRKAFAYAVAAQVLLAQGCTCPSVEEAEKLELL